jgi:hypothetical protein
MRVALALVVLAAAVVGGLFGAAVGFGAGKLRPPKYVATATVRSPLADGQCFYYSCPVVNPSSSGIPYVLSQAQLIPTSAVAQPAQSAWGKTSPSVSQLGANVKAAEIGTSSSIAIAYTAKTAAEAQQGAAAFGNGFVSYENGQAVKSLGKAIAAYTLLLNGNTAAKPPASIPDKASLEKDLATLLSLQTSFTGPGGPNAAVNYAPTPADASVKASGLAPVRSAGIGAFVGCILGVIVLLVVLSRSRDDAAPVDQDEEWDSTETDAEPEPYGATRETSHGAEPERPETVRRG